MENRWSDGQIELFHALGKICDWIGKEGVNGMYFALKKLCLAFVYDILFAYFRGMDWRCAK
jgi:hypothetical protein